MFSSQYPFQCLRHIALQSQSATGTHFLCFAKESKQRKATRGDPGSAVPLLVVSQTKYRLSLSSRGVRFNGLKSLYSTSAASILGLH